MKRFLFPFFLPVLLLFVHFIQGQNVTKSYDVDSLITACLADVNNDSVSSYLQFLEDKGTRFLMAPNRREVAESIKEKFLQLGVDHARIDSFLCETKINMWNLHFDTTTWQYNVVGTIDGVTDANQCMVMGAHYDCVVSPNGDPMVFAPGADDNASGVVAMFECVRILSDHQFQPLYDLEFVAFAAEELMYFGHSGAQAYVDTALAHGMNMELMINNDMIAYTASEEWELKVSNYVGSQWITYIAEEITDTYTIIDPVVTSLSGQAGADCKYFYEAGVPCVYFMERDFNPYYHTEQDLVEHCDIGYTAEAIKVSLGCIIKANDYVITAAPERDKPGFGIHPNPAVDQLHITFDHNHNKGQNTYKILDMNGREVLKGISTNPVEHLVDIRFLPNGPYVISVSQGSSTIPEHRIFLKR